MKQEHSYPLYTDYNEHRDMRDMLTSISLRYSEQTAISYRLHPLDDAVARISYRQLFTDVRAIGEEALRRGMHGKRCALIGALSYGWICTYLAMLSIGTVLVPLDKDWGEEELAATVLSAECDYLFCDASVRPKLPAIFAATGITSATFLADAEKGEEPLSLLVCRGTALVAGGSDAFDRAEIDPLALALLVFTSGTTGQGKGVMLTQKAILSNIANGLKYIRVGRKTIGVLPPQHTFGSTIGILAHLAVGTNLFLSGGLKYIVRELRQESPDYLILVPLFLETFHRRIFTAAKEKGREKLLRRMMKFSDFLRRFGIDLRRRFFGRSILSSFGGRLRLIISGGAPLSQEIIDDFDSLGITVLNGYGITECAPLIAANRNLWHTPGSVGPVLPCDTVRIDNPNEHGEGEICVSGPNVMLGYWKNPDATRAAMTDDGFFRTGDIGRLDSEGRLYITGRLKNLIILSNGKNVYPEEIELSLSSVPGVADIVVYEGISRRGNIYNTVVAEVYPDPDYLAKNGVTDVEAYLRPYIDDYNRTAVPYKKIGLLRVRQEPFPKNTLRKITRFKLDRTID